LRFAASSARRCSASRWGTVTESPADREDIHPGRDHVACVDKRMGVGEPGLRATRVAKIQREIRRSAHAQRTDVDIVWCRPPCGHFVPVSPVRLISQILTSGYYCSRAFRLRDTFKSYSPEIVRVAGRTLDTDPPRYVTTAPNAAGSFPNGNSRNRSRYRP
jgi:hypothetical protein